MNRFPDSGPLIPRLRYLHRGSIEEALDQFREHAGRDPERIRQLAAIRFYIQSAIASCESSWFGHHHSRTNYRTLLDDIRSLQNTDVTVVTFNYDCLLDDAAARVSQRTIIGIDDLLKLDPFSVFKVHGSVNWGREVAEHGTSHVNDEDLISAALIKNAATLKLLDSYELVHEGNAPIVRHHAKGKVLLPAIAVPHRTKAEFECPSEHITLLQAKLRAVRRILIIGWSGLDQHFVKLLAENLPGGVTVQVVCGLRREHGDELINALRAGGVDAKWQLLEHTFTSYIRTGVGEDLLTPP